MIYTILKIARRELIRIFTLPSHYIVLVVIPPLLFFFYAFIYQGQTAKDLPMAIWDEDHSPLSRQVAFMLEQTPSIHITETAAGQAELQQLMRTGRILGAVHFPKGMEAKVKSSQPVHVTLYTNTASLVPGKLIYKDAAQVIITTGLGVVLEKLQRQGVPEGKAKGLIQTLPLLTYNLYNPTYNYQQYLVPGLVTVAIQMIIIMVAVIMLNYETEHGTLYELKLLSGNSAAKIITGKTIAHLLVSWINFILIAFIIFPVFGIGHLSVTGNFFILYSLLSLACIGVGVLFSAIFKEPMLAADAGLFYTSPAFVFSGYTFPRWAMPWYDQYYAQLMPYTAFLDAFIKIFTMQLPLSYATTEIGKLLLFIAVTFPVSIFLFQQQLNRTTK